MLRAISAVVGFRRIIVQFGSTANKIDGSRHDVVLRSAADKSTGERVKFGPRITVKPLKLNLGFIC